jgi:peptidoglycan/LPS O-acetylase OafA/YrhL
VKVTGAERIRVLARRLGLAGSGLTFGGIALLSILAPDKVAAKYAYGVGTPDSYNEFHAVFTGFWLGLCVLMLSAARRPEERRLGDLAGLAIGLQALARLLSIAAHGVPSASFTSAMVGELATAALILQAGPIAERLGQRAP